MNHPDAKLIFPWVTFLLSLGIYVAPTPILGQVSYDKLQTAPLPVRQIAGHSIFQYAWTTDQAVYIMYDGKLHTHTSLQYTAAGTTHNPSVSAIEDLMMTDFGRLFIRTSDGYTLAFDEGVFSGGINLESFDFSSVSDLNVESFALMDYLGDILAVRHLDKLWDIQFQYDYYDDALVNQFQQLQPNLYGAYLGHHVFVNGETPEIGVVYSSGHELKVHQEGTSHFPCSGFSDVVTRGHVSFLGIQNPFAVISLACTDGRLAIIKRHLTNNNAYTTNFQPQEWRVIDFPFMGRGNVLQIEAPKPFSSTSGDEREFVFGRTDQVDQGLFVINTKKETHCFLDTPGALPISDFYVDNPNRLFLATGQEVYLADISQVECASSTSTEEYNASSQALFHVLANPCSQVLDVRCRTEEIASNAHFQLISPEGRLFPVYFRAQGLQLTSAIDHLPAGLYLLQVIYESENQTTKVIILP